MSEPKTRSYQGNEIRCPYCGEAQCDPWDLYDGDGDHICEECQECKRPFAFHVRTETWCQSFPVDADGNMMRADIE